ncbi:MAG: anti-sigma factor [Actinomycetota bacterium]|nr:anti-sigma factor [Actinomycetota bacterium]
MTSAVRHEEVQSLLGAFALDAVVGDEADTIEFHLLECVSCRSEVTDYLEMAGALAGSYSPAPAPLWDGIAANLAPASFAPVVPMRRRRYQRFAVAAASIAAVAIGALGVRIVEQDQRIEHTQSALEDRTVLAAALAAQGDPSARRADLRSGDGKVLAHAVLTRDGTGYLWSDGLPALSPARTYQLWAVIGNEPISAGLLGATPRVAPFRASGPVVGLAITEEGASGVGVSHNQPVVSGLVQES